MAVVLGTSSGFVTVAPTADPNGTGVTIDGSSVVTKDTSPAGAVKITSIGWYRASGTNAANWEIALYADSAGVAGARLFVDATNSTTSNGWVVTAVDWTISPSTPYWLGLQMDAHSGSSSVDSEASGGAGSDILTSQTALNDPYGGGAVADADGMYAIYALVQVAPTTALNTPADSATGISTTPTLEFTGTDSNNDSVSYNIQVDTVNTFDSTTAVIDSYSESNQSGVTPMAMTNAAVHGHGQSFLNTKSCVLSGATFYLQNSSSATGQIVAKIYAHSGTFGTSSVPTGSPLDTSSAVDVTTIGSSLTLVNFTFSGNIVLADNTHYVVTVERSVVGTNSLNVGIDSTSPSHAGNGCEENPSQDSWIAGSNDRIFYIRRKSTLIDKFSDTDSGFSNTTDGADTDPFDSGDKADYDVQVADTLDNSTQYFWRARAKDPSGTNTYGAWSSTRSFTTNSAFTASPMMHMMAQSGGLM